MLIEELPIELLRSGASSSFRVRCSKGTYVRTLVEDIARGLGPWRYRSICGATDGGAFERDDACARWRSSGGRSARVCGLGRPACCRPDTALTGWPHGPSVLSRRCRAVDARPGFPLVQSCASGRTSTIFAGGRSSDIGRVAPKRLRLAPHAELSSLTAWSGTECLALKSALHTNKFEQMSYDRQPQSDC